MRAIFVCCGAVLIIATGAFFVYDLHSFRQITRSSYPSASTSRTRMRDSLIRAASLESIPKYSHFAAVFSFL